MNLLTKSMKKCLFFRLVSAVVTVLFTLQSTVMMPFALAQGVPGLPVPGSVVSLSPSYTPAIMAGITLYPDNPLQFDFIIDAGDSLLGDEALRLESEKLIRYFLSALTVPEDELWVNLSPVEQDRIIAGGLGHTVMGRDMLAQDYLLKQLTASLMHPDGDLGKKFWREVRTQARAQFGMDDIPADLFHKVWIVPERASIYRRGTSIFIADSRLKVMLADDYDAMLKSQVETQNFASLQDTTNESSAMSVAQSAAMREIILPAIEKEVNEGKNFAPLRQIYHSMILAAWYKKNLRTSVLGKVYADQNKTAGVDVEDKNVKFKIYDQYLEAFRKGVYDFIREDTDEVSGAVIPRHYFSGGEDFAMLTHAVMSDAGHVAPNSWLSQRAREPKVRVTTGMTLKFTRPPAAQTGDFAMITEGAISPDRAALIAEVQGYLEAIDFKREEPGELTPDEQSRVRSIFGDLGVGYLGRTDLRKPDLLLSGLLVLLEYDPAEYARYLMNEHQSRAGISQRIIAQMSLDSGHLLNPVIFPAIDLRAQILPMRDRFDPIDRESLDGLLILADDVITENFSLARVLKDFVVFQDGPMSVFLLGRIKAHLDKVEVFNRQALQLAEKYAYLGGGLPDFGGYTKQYIERILTMRDLISKWERGKPAFIVEGFNPIADTEGSVQAVSLMLGVPITFTTDATNRKQHVHFSKYDFFYFLKNLVEDISRIRDGGLGSGAVVEAAVEDAGKGRILFRLDIRIQDGNGTAQQNLRDFFQGKEFYGRTIDIDSTEGEGMTFTITLPLERAPAPGTRPADGAMLGKRTAASAPAVEFDPSAMTASWDGRPMRFIGRGGNKIVFERTARDGSRSAVAIARKRAFNPLRAQIHFTMKLAADLGVMPGWISDGYTKKQKFYYFETQYVDGIPLDEFFSGLVFGEESARDQALGQLIEALDLFIFARIRCFDLLKTSNWKYGRIDEDDSTRPWFIDPDLMERSRMSQQELAGEYLRLLHRDVGGNGIGRFDPEGLVAAHLEKIIAGEYDVSYPVISRLNALGYPLVESIEELEKVMNQNDLAMLGEEETGSVFGQGITISQIEAVERGIVRDPRVLREEARDGSAAFQAWYSRRRLEMDERYGDDVMMPLADMLSRYFENFSEDIEQLERMMMRTDRKFVLEIGAGSTQDTWNMARRNPDVNVAAFDLYGKSGTDRNYPQYSAMFRNRDLVVQRQPLANAAALQGDLGLALAFPDSSIDKLVFINPSDEAIKDLIVLMREFSLAKKFKPGTEIIIKAGPAVEPFLEFLRDDFDFRLEGPGEIDVLGVTADRLGRDWDQEYLRANVYIGAVKKSIGEDVSVSQGETPGGIDLNPETLNWEEQGDASFEFIYTGQPEILPETIDGLTPVIINIVPITNFPLLLGIKESEDGELVLK